MMNIYTISICSIEDIRKPKLLIEVPVKAESKSIATSLGQDIAFDKYPKLKRMIDVRS